MKNTVLKSSRGWYCVCDNSLKCELWWGLLTSFGATDPTICPSRIVTKKKKNNRTQQNCTMGHLGIMEVFHLILCMLRAHLECSSSARAHGFTPPAFCLQGHHLFSFPGWRGPRPGITSFQESVLTASCSQLDSCVQSLSRARLFATPWTVARQAPLFMGILQARILEWVAISSPRGSSQSRDRTWVSCVAGRFFTVGATGGAPPGVTALTFYPHTSLHLHHSVSHIMLTPLFEHAASTDGSCRGGVITHLCAPRRYCNALDKENIQ